MGGGRAKGVWLADKATIYILVSSPPSHLTPLCRVVGKGWCGGPWAIQVDYMHELALLDACRPQRTSLDLIAVLGVIQTLLQVPMWERRLQNQPDREFMAYLLSGMRFGFRVGFNRQAVCLKSVKRNMQSAAEEPKVIESLPGQGAHDREGYWPSISVKH